MDNGPLPTLYLLHVRILSLMGWFCWMLYFKSLHVGVKSPNKFIA